MEGKRWVRGIAGERFTKISIEILTEIDGFQPLSLLRRQLPLHRGAFRSTHEAYFSVCRVSCWRYCRGVTPQCSRKVR